MDAHQLIILVFNKETGVLNILEIHINVCRMFYFNSQ